MPEPIDPDIIPVNWETRPVIHGIEVIIHCQDDIGMPFDRRGLHLSPPQDPVEWAEFARQVGVSVQKTIRHILKEAEK